jgi:hypothetical protein
VVAEGVPEAVQLAADRFDVLRCCLAVVFGVIEELRPLEALLEGRGVNDRACRRVAGEAAGTSDWMTESGSQGRWALISNLAWCRLGCCGRRFLRASGQAFLRQHDRDGWLQELRIAAGRNAGTGVCSYIWVGGWFILRAGGSGGRAQGTDPTGMIEPIAHAKKPGARLLPRTWSIVSLVDFSEPALTIRRKDFPAGVAASGA